MDIVSNVQLDTRIMCKTHNAYFCLYITYNITHIVTYNTYYYQLDWKYLRVAGIIPGLDNQFMDPLQFIIQGPVQSDNPGLHIHDKVAVWVTLTTVDFIQDQAIISFVLI